MSERSCGDCSMCCKTLPIKSRGTALTGEKYEMVKPPHTWCQHWVKGAGCGIYTSPVKPLTCSLFKCLWLRGAGRESAKPNKTKVILDLSSLVDPNPQNGLLYLCADEEEAGAFFKNISRLRSILFSATLTYGVQTCRVKIQGPNAWKKDELIYSYWEIEGNPPRDIVEVDRITKYDSKSWEEADWADDDRLSPEEKQKILGNQSREELLQVETF